MAKEVRKGKERKERKDGRTRWEWGVVPSSMILFGRVCLVLVSSRSPHYIDRSHFFYDGWMCVCVCVQGKRGENQTIFFLCEIF